MAKKRPPIRGRIRSALRKVWAGSEMRRDALAKARIRRGVYVCARCGGEFGRNEISVDHVTALGPSPGSRNDDGTATWDALVERMFCDADELRVLCNECHGARTKQQRKGIAC